MGEVYLGEHVDLRRPAVIKLIKRKYANEDQVVGRMKREARIVARIRHDALVTIYDLGTTADGRTYIAMEWLEGVVLRRLLQQRGALAPEEASRLVAQACDGLDVATRPASSTATSNPRTSSSPPPASSRCSTSASPSR